MTFDLRRGCRAAIVAGVAFLLFGAPAAAAVGCGDVANATINGTWTLRSHVDSLPSGDTHPAYPLGSSGTDTVRFNSTCATPSTCEVIGLNATGPPQVAYYSTTTGIYWPPVESAPRRSGATWTGKYSPGGYGGPDLPPCSPPPLVYTMTLTVLQAVPGPGGTSRAVLVSGVATSPGIWRCVAGGPSVPLAGGSTSFVAVPEGDAYPASITPPPCATGAIASIPDAAATSTLSTTLATPQQAFSSLGRVALNAAIAVALMLFLTFPSQLFNKTFEENYLHIRALARRRWHRRPRRRSLQRRVAVFTGVLLAGALLGSLNDPNFALSGTSLRTYIAVVLAIVVGIALGYAVGAIYRLRLRRNFSVTPRALPAGLVVAGLCVVVSRTTAFTPGYLYGVICSLAFTESLSTAQSARVAAIRALSALALGAVMWAIWLPVARSAAVADPSPAVSMAATFLSGVVNSSIVGTVLTLLPLSFMPGGVIFSWNRRFWAAVFAVAAFAMISVMLNPASSHASRASVVTGVLLFAVFGGGSLGFHRYFRAFHARRARAKRSRAESSNRPTHSASQIA